MSTRIHFTTALWISVSCATSDLFDSEDDGDFEASTPVYERDSLAGTIYEFGAENGSDDYVSYEYAD